MPELAENATPKDSSLLALWLAHLAPWAAALWWGSLTTLAGYVVPMLFANLPSPLLAGNMAAKLFALQTWLSLACGLLLLLAARLEAGQRKAWFSVLLGLLLALLLELAVAPRIVLRQNLALWHSVGVVFYLGQWLCAGFTLGRLLNRRASHKTADANGAGDA